MKSSRASFAFWASSLLAAPAEPQTFEVLRAFGGGEGCPGAGLVQADDGDLYGTTNCGGAHGLGTIFRIDSNGSRFETLHSFAGGGEGASEISALIQATDGNLYGTTESGGTGVACSQGCGTIFRIGTDGSGFTTLYSFAGGNDGAVPIAALIQGADGLLYGTTAGGGTSGWGTVFKMDVGGSALTTLHSFDRTHGMQPYAGVVEGADGKLYGATNWGPAPDVYTGFGTIYRIDNDGSNFTTLHVFDQDEDGAFPYGGLVQGSDGKLYGTTYYGVQNAFGTIFQIETDGSHFTTLYPLAYVPDGSNPFARLIQGADGRLYGTAIDGGTNGSFGTVFRVDTDGTAFEVLHSFDGVDGALPYGHLIQARDGNLYGTAMTGGANGTGVVFRFGRLPRLPPVRLSRESDTRLAPSRP